MVSLNSVLAEIEPIVHFKARRLRRVYGLTFHDEEDLRQSLWVDLARAAQRYDLDRAPLPQYLRACSDRWYAYQTRTLRVAARRFVVIDHDTVLSRPASNNETADLINRLYVEDLLSRLPMYLATTLLALVDDSVTDVARSTGVHRSTIHRWLREVRTTMPEFDPAIN